MTLCGPPHDPTAKLSWYGGRSLHGGNCCMTASSQECVHIPPCANQWSLVALLFRLHLRDNVSASLTWPDCRAVQIIGFLLGIAGFGLGFSIRGSWSTPYAVHRNLGVAVMVLGTAQVCHTCISGCSYWWNTAGSFMVCVGRPPEGT